MRRIRNFHGWLSPLALRVSDLGGVMTRNGDENCTTIKDRRIAHMTIRRDGNHCPWARERGPSMEIEHWDLCTVRPDPGTCRGDCHEECMVLRSHDGTTAWVAYVWVFLHSCTGTDGESRNSEALPLPHAHMLMLFAWWPEERS